MTAGFITLPILQWSITRKIKVTAHRGLSRSIFIRIDVRISRDAGSLTRDLGDTLDDGVVDIPGHVASVAADEERRLLVRQQRDEFLLLFSDQILHVL